MEYIFAFIFLVVTIALGVLLGTLHLRPKKDYTDDYYLGRLQAIGVLSNYEYKEVSNTLKERWARENDLEAMRNTLVGLKELGYFSQPELEEKQKKLDQYFGN